MGPLGDAVCTSVINVGGRAHPLEEPPLDRLVLREYRRAGGRRGRGGVTRPSVVAAAVVDCVRQQGMHVPCQAAGHARP
eukprot:1715118-Rhodomonas_salina.1